MKLKIINGASEITLYMNESNLRMMKQSILDCLEDRNTYIAYKDLKSDFIFTAEFLKRSLIETINEDKL